LIVFLFSFICLVFTLLFCRPLRLLFFIFIVFILILHVVLMFHHHILFVSLC
jgi:hypothetical protein